MNMENLKGEELNKINNFVVGAGNILCCLYQRFGNGNNIVSFNSQQHEVHNERVIMLHIKKMKTSRKTFYPFSSIKDT